MFKWLRKKDWRLIAVVTHGTRYLFSMDGYNDYAFQADYHFYENENGGRKVKIYNNPNSDFLPKESRFWGWCMNWKKGLVQSKAFPTYKAILEGEGYARINTAKGEGV